MQVERVDGVRLVRRDEDDRRWRPEPPEHLGELEPRETGHLDVEEDCVDLALVQGAERLGRRVAGDHLADPVVLVEEVLQLVERRPLVVDDQHAQPLHAHAGCHRCTPAANFGTRTVTLVPAPGAVSTTSP